MSNTKTVTYLLMSPDLTTVVDRLDVPRSTWSYRRAAEEHWVDRLETGHTIWSSIDTNEHDIKKAREAKAAGLDKFRVSC